MNALSHYLFFNDGPTERHTVQSIQAQIEPPADVIDSFISDDPERVQDSKQMNSKESFDVIINLN